MLLAKITRRISAIAFALAGVMLFFPSSCPTLAQTPQSVSQPQQPEADVDDNPTRVVFFSVREEYRNLINGAFNNRLILRKDAVVLKGKRVGGRTGYLLRTDVPITTTHLGSETHTGLGDIYGQGSLHSTPQPLICVRHRDGHCLSYCDSHDAGTREMASCAAGSARVVPAAGEGFFLVKFQDFISIAGVGDRPDVHTLFINPTLNYIPARRWLVQAEVESETNWKTDTRTDFRVGFGAGRVITRRMFLGIKCEVPLGATRSGDWTLKVTNILYR